MLSPIDRIDIMQPLAIILLPFQKLVMSGRIIVNLTTQELAHGNQVSCSGSYHWRLPCWTAQTFSLSRNPSLLQRCCRALSTGLIGTILLAQAFHWGWNYHCWRESWSHPWFLLSKVSFLQKIHIEWLSKLFGSGRNKWILLLQWQS